MSEDYLQIIAEEDGLFSQCITDACKFKITDEKGYQDRHGVLLI